MKKTTVKIKFLQLGRVRINFGSHMIMVCDKQKNNKLTVFLVNIGEVGCFENLSKKILQFETKNILIITTIYII